MEFGDRSDLYVGAVLVDEVLGRFIVDVLVTRGKKDVDFAIHLASVFELLLALVPGEALDLLDGTFVVVDFVLSGIAVLRKDEF